MNQQQNIQILKCRDDPRPIFFKQESENTPLKFVLTDDTVCSWINKDEPFSPEKIRSRIEPWLTALCQSEHLSLLIGAGLSYAVYNLAIGNLESLMEPVTFGEEFDALIKKASIKSAKLAGRNDGNIEDQIRVANELLRGLEILGLKDESALENAKKLQRKIDKVLKDFAERLLKLEYDLFNAKKEKLELAFNYLVSFLMSFASRTGTRDRLHIFTTNYDRLIEAGADISGLYLIDRFVGFLSPIFRSSRLNIDLHYNPPGIRGEPRYVEGVVRFTKLHGSLDWIDWDKNIRRLGIPFGAETIEPYLQVLGTDLEGFRLMIYPNAAKDRETVFYPYSELFRDFAAAICRPNHTLVVFGYSFGDEHIVRIIEDMLTIPSTHLVIISRDDPMGRIMTIYEKIGRPAQITLMIGDHIGNFKTVIDYYLPKPAIDRTTFRMAELLRSRLTTEYKDFHETGSNGEDKNV